MAATPDDPLSPFYGERVRVRGNVTAPRPMKKILILGGTAEARQLAGKLAAQHDVTLSLAGRTENPVAQGVPVRSRRLRRRRGSCRLSQGQPHRPAGRRDPSLCRADLCQRRRGRAPRRRSRHRTAPPRLGTRCPATAGRSVDSAAEAVAAARRQPREKSFSRSAGRNSRPSRPRRSTPISSAASIRSSRRSPCLMPTYILARGPFSEADDRALLEAHGIDAIVAKNSGGQATYGKIAAARALGIEVFLIRRPPLPDMPSGAERRGGFAPRRSCADQAEKRGV